MNHMMADADCVKFLQWALPKLRMRWPGFRKVRSQVCKRLKRRVIVLGLNDYEDYRSYLEGHPEEWHELDSLCQVTISRFYRDKLMFATLTHHILPTLVRQAIDSTDKSLRVWSVGCASGEEPYTLALIWRLQLVAQFPGLEMHTLATDINPHLLNRARCACYTYSAIKNLPAVLREAGFFAEDGQHCLRSEYRDGIEFIEHDVRDTPPAGPFQLILCRNLVLTYFDLELQQKVMQEIGQSLAPNGFLVIGVHERLPEDIDELKPYSEKLGIYTKLNSFTD